MSTRSLAISIAENPAIKSLFEKQGMKSPLVRRFVAGVTLRDALISAKEFHDDNILSTLDYLGENVLTAEEAIRSTDTYVDVIRQIAIFCPDAYVSLKLTSLGLDISEELARENLRRLTSEARARGGVFIRVDMEDSNYTSRTLQIVCDEHKHYLEIGTVLQSALRRTDKDLELLIKENVPVRLVKGAYLEPPSHAYPNKADVDAAFRKQMYLLLESGYRPAIATHDEDIIKIARRFIKQKAIAPNRYEFQMLLGVRHNLQKSLVKEGHTVRVYVPFGQQWYPYFTRRLAENPANMGFLLGNMLKG